jgi:MFS family permease
VPGKLNRHQLTVLILALMATGIGQSLVFAILAPLGREVQLAELQITSIIAISALIFGLVAPRWGRLSDRVGRRPVIITGLLGYTAGTLVFTTVFQAGLTGVLAGTTLYLVLLAVRGSQSLVMSATNPAATAYAADHSSPEQRTRTMARLGTANSMGTILGPAVSGALATFGLLAPLYFAAGLAFLAALLVWWQLPVTPRSELTRREVAVRLRFTDRRILLLLTTATGLFVGFSGIQQTLGFQLQDKLDLTGIRTAQMTGAALMVSATFTFLIQVTVMQRLKLRPTRGDRGLPEFRGTGGGHGLSRCGAGTVHAGHRRRRITGGKARGAGRGGGPGERLSAHRLRVRADHCRRPLPGPPSPGAPVQRRGVLPGAGAAGHPGPLSGRCLYLPGTKSAATSRLFRYSPGQWMKKTAPPT